MIDRESRNAILAHLDSTDHCTLLDSQSVAYVQTQTQRGGPNVQMVKVMGVAKAYGVNLCELSSNTRTWINGLDQGWVHYWHHLMMTHHYKVDFGQCGGLNEFLVWSWAPEGYSLCGMFPVLPGCAWVSFGLSVFFLIPKKSTVVDSCTIKVVFLPCTQLTGWKKDAHQVFCWMCEM